jgi:hypothetical protein
MSMLGENGLLEYFLTTKRTKATKGSKICVIMNFVLFVPFVVKIDFSFYCARAFRLTPIS